MDPEPPPSSSEDDRARQPVPSLTLDSAEALLDEGSLTLHQYVATQLQRAVGDQKRPTLDIRFRNVLLFVETHEVVRKETDPSISTNSNTRKPELPTLPNVVKHNVGHGLAACRNKTIMTKKCLLKNLSGVLKPGSMTLVLGQPGSGKSLFLHLLSGQLPMDKRLCVEGEVTYNSLINDKVKDKLPQLVAFVPQQDAHLATLTVKETIEFAHKCCTQDLSKHIEELSSSSSSKEEKSPAQATAKALWTHFPQVMISQLGLDQCQNTIIGNDMLRGVSGGERKRVTIGEMLLGMQLALFMDSISTGLDSAATFDLISSMRSLAKSLSKTVIISLLQPSPEVFELFDEVVLLNEGQVMYHGPRTKIAEYFEQLGLVCPPERDFADFLLDLGTEEQSKFFISAAAATHAPRTATDFAEHFRKSSIHQAMLRELDDPHDAHVLAATHTLMDMTPVFQQHFWQSTWAVSRRELVILSRNSAFLKGRTVMVIVMGLLYSSVFYQFDPKNIQVVMGITFSASFFVSMGQASQIPTLMAAREIFYKQRRANFFRSSSFVLANSISRLPVALAETLVFGSLTYWLCGFASNAVNFIIYELILLLTSLMFGAWYFFVVTVTPNTNVAMPLAMVSVLFYVMFAGFVISKNQIPDYLIWLYWISPMAWCVRSLAVNEYRASAYDVCEYEDVKYCATFSGKHMGEYYLSLFDVPSEKFWVGSGMIFMAFSYVIFLILAVWTLENRRFESPEASYPAETTQQTQELDDDVQNDNSIAAGFGLMQTPKMRDVVLLGDEQESSDISISIPQFLHPSHQLNFVPVTLAFKDLWYSVPVPAKAKGEKPTSVDLLKGVSGYARPGTMTALMGSSGAGKTTLMDVIAGRKTGGTVRGKIFLNGYEATDLVMRRCTGYCEQTDVHCDATTFREALIFSAFLRQGSDVPDVKKLESVEECLELLNLTSIADKIVRGSSMEQMKRLTIGVELAAQPSILFLDEPTSGLDANSAKSIMTGVRNVARSGRTVMTTIHQPSAEVFGLFDSVLLLKRGGVTVFFGDIGGSEARTLIDYFEAIPGLSSIAPGSNPATWMLACIGAGITHNEGIEDIDFVATFRNSKLHTNLLNTLDQEGMTRPLPNGTGQLTFSAKRAATHWTQMQFLLDRSMKTYWRTASYSLTRLVISMVLGLFFGIVFINADYTTFQGINAGIGMVFLATGFNGIVSFFSVLPVASAERSVFYRERASQTYSALWYFVGATIIEIPYVLLCALLFTVIFYPMVGFTGAHSGVMFWINTALLLLLQTYMGQLMLYILPSTEVAMVLGILLNTMSFLFMGFNPPAQSIPSGYRWLYQINPQRYTFSILSAIVFADCSDDDAQASSTDKVGCQPLRGAPLTMSYSNTKEYIENVFGAEFDMLGRNIAIVIGIIVFLRIMALLALRFVNHQNR